MPLHESTFDYIQPTYSQIEKMKAIRAATRAYASALEIALYDGPDKSYLLRKLREVGMWANVAITRLPDGTPRPDDDPVAP